MQRLLVVLALGALVACSEAGSGGSAPGGSTAGTGSTTAPITFSASLSGATTLPSSFTPAAVAASGGIDVAVGGTWSPPGTISPSVALAAVRRDQGPWELVNIDRGADYNPPAVASDPTYGWSATAVASGPTGFVAVGGAAYYNDTVAAGSGALVWFSADGSSWTRADLRSLLLLPDARGLQLSGVVATSTGYVVFGRDGYKNALLFFSADGQTWTLAHQRLFPWAVLPRGLFADGDRVVAWYDEYECLDDTFASGTQPVLLSSLNGGSSWAAVNMSAVPTLSKYAPEPDAAACAASGTSFEALAAAYHGSFSVLGLADGRFTVVDDGSTAVATSTDTVTWTKAALGEPRPNTTSVSFYTLGNAFRVFTWSDNLVAMTRSLPATPTSAMQVIGWLSADGGLTWVPVGGFDAGTATTQVVISQQPDGRVFVILQPRDDQTHVVGSATVAELLITAA